MDADDHFVGIISLAQDAGSQNHNRALNHFLPMQNRQSIILVVDDNPTNLKLISEVLEFEGHRIIKAHSPTISHGTLLIKQARSTEETLKRLFPL